MTDKFSLKQQMLLGSIVIFLLCVTLSFLLSASGSFLLNYLYMNETAVERRQIELANDLAAFVEKNSIARSDTKALSAWSAKHGYVAVTVYSYGQRYSRYYNGEVETGISLNPPDLPTMYSIPFSDGENKVEIVDDTSSWLSSAIKFSAIAVSGLCFVMIGIVFTQKLTGRIIALSEEAAIVGSGDIDHAIVSDGQDELTELALLMDKMRLSVIERMGSESRAWESNAELITAISHDIRTPMTSLLGYLDLLRDSTLDDRESSHQFISSAYDKAMELKDLTDELFRYFLLYGKAELDLQLEIFDGRLMLEQFMAEAEFELSDAGFRVNRIETEGEYRLRVDPLYLKRVVDNMVSNIKKYADPSRSVTFIAESSEDRLSLCFSNYISRSMDRVESTKIGLRSCAKIMQAMGGSFEIQNDGEHFSAEICLPKLEKE